MVRIRSTSDIINSLLDFYKAAQPQLDTKPGSVPRDLLIDGPSSQLARLYEELARIRSAQSLRLSLGLDLDRLGGNFGATRKQGSKSSGPALITFNSIDADIPINRGDIVTASNGATFTVTTGQTVSQTSINQYRAVAARHRADLDFLGITDEFAVEVLTEATAPGVIGNISKYSLVSITTDGASNVTNVQAFSGGSAAEDDAAFKNRVISIFSGGATGTATGYRTAVRADPAVIDAIVVEPGDPLMTRDGTQVSIAEDGTRTIISDGTGGKVDIYVFGLRLVEILDSFIYRDQSNKDDPTDPANDFVLGQIEGDENKTVTRKRIDNLETGILPAQPANDIIEVSGSSSGTNFVEKQVDSLGRITGNYELIRDTGAYAGSPWGFDKLHFISDRISDYVEDQTKGRFNGQDPVTFSDVLEVNSISQEVQITNENSSVSPSNRSSIQLPHSPISTVTRVFNVTTGERYVVADQNPDGEGNVNDTGRILISGNTLPAVSDTLQIDYTWVLEYDPNFDLDNRVNDTNPRTVLDSVDWGFSNAVRREGSSIVASGSLKTVTITHPISSVISVNTFESETLTVSLVQGRLAVVTNNAVENVVSIKRSSDEAELFDTDEDDGSFSGLTIFLPTDTTAEFGDTVATVYNIVDIFTSDGVTGSFDSNLITLPASTTATAGELVECNYIANVRTILPTTLLPALPAIRSGNGFNTTVSTGIGTQPTTHLYSSPSVIAQNLRIAPSRLQLAISGTISPGVITISGTTFMGVFDAVLKVANSGLKHDLSSLIRSALGLSSTTTIPSSVGLSRIISVKKVTTSSALDVLSVDHTYGVKGYKLKDDSFVKDECVQDSSLSRTEFELPATPDNQEESLSVGDRLQITFYIYKTNESENVSFSKAGVLYTDKIFALIDTVSISSGFTSGSSQTATLTISNLNQPSTGTRYSVSYDYLAPKTNERITIRYNHNRLITDTTLALEDFRIISADVLLKSSIPVLVDVSLAIIVANEFASSSTIVQQNVRNSVTSALNATSLGTIIDASDIQRVAASVEGVDRVRVTFFNMNGETGSALSIEAQKNEFIQANNITVVVETR